MNKKNSSMLYRLDGSIEKTKWIGIIKIMDTEQDDIQSVFGLMKNKNKEETLYVYGSLIDDTIRLSGASKKDVMFNDYILTKNKLKQFHGSNKSGGYSYRMDCSILNKKIDKNHFLEELENFEKESPFLRTEIMDNYPELQLKSTLDEQDRVTAVQKSLKVGSKVL